MVEALMATSFSRTSSLSDSSLWCSRMGTTSRRKRQPFATYSIKDSPDACEGPNDVGVVHGFPAGLFHGFAFAFMGGLAGGPEGPGCIRSVEARKLGQFIEDPAFFLLGRPMIDSREFLDH